MSIDPNNVDTWPQTFEEMESHAKDLYDVFLQDLKRHGPQTLAESIANVCALVMFQSRQMKDDRDQMWNALEQITEIQQITNKLPWSERIEALERHRGVAVMSIDVEQRRHLANRPSKRWESTTAQRSLLTLGPFLQEAETATDQRTNPTPSRSLNVCGVYVMFQRSADEGRPRSDLGTVS